jgi:hypothetical protein
MQRRGGSVPGKGCRRRTDTARCDTLTGTFWRWAAAMNDGSVSCDRPP